MLSFKTTIMKKLFFAAVVMAAAVMTGCGNKTNASAAGDDSVAVDSAAVTQSAADSLMQVLSSNVEAKDAKSFEATMQVVKAKYDELVKAGLVDEAKAYAAQFKEYLGQHADEVKAIAGGNATVNSIVDAVTNLPTSVDKAAETAVDAAKANVNEKVESGKKAVNEAVEKKKNEAQQKANEAVDKATNNAKKAVGNALNGVLGK